MDMRQHIRESNLIEGIDSLHEDERSRRVWEHFLKDEPKLTNAIICYTQKLITDNQNLPWKAQGWYRDFGAFSVEVGGRSCPHYNQVPHSMEMWLDLFSEKAENPIQAHIAFEKIHPFLDGNGRTGRMLLWWHEIKNGQEPTLFLNSEKFDVYYPLFD